MMPIPPRHADEELDGILDAVERAANLTRQLLLFSRERAPDPGVMELAEGIRDVLPLLRRLVPARIRLDVEIAPGPHPVVGDVDALERLLMNLVVNALDAIDDTGRIRIAVDRVEPTGSGPSECRLVVEDTGHGIPPEERERIFDPFFTTKPEGRGSGLGLSTVFGIVAEMEGRIEV